MTNSKGKTTKEQKIDTMANVLENRGRNWILESPADDDTESTYSVEGEEDDDIDTCSSFSLQECIDEFRARRIRRISTQSREFPITSQHDDNVANGAVVDDDEDLEKQNRTNKEQERKCKPCKNGFCYCFTSDSGDGGGGCSVNGTMPAATRATHMRRSRKSDTMQLPKYSTKSKDSRRHSVPAAYKQATHETKHFDNETNNIKAETIAKSNLKSMHLPITAISRLETSSNDAPFIHIIQELHNNCVVSEVRVNQQKLETYQQFSRNIVTQTVQKNFTPTEEKDDEPDCQSKTTLSAKTTKSSQKQSLKETYQQQAPSAPPLETISEIDSAIEALEMCKLETQKRRNKYGGRLLQKRLSYTGVAYKPTDYKKPPRKPPRSSYPIDSSKYSSDSTTPSLRNAKQVIDKFLLDRGVALPTAENQSKPPKKNSLYAAAVQLDKRKSYPLTAKKTTSNIKTKPMRTYPSLSDFEHFAEAKQTSMYEKNLSKKPKSPNKHIKELRLGWTESKISEMLNCDTNGNRREFKTQACQAEPQSIGWQIPPKISLDTVDGPVQQNLATNIQHKDTPVKSPQVSPKKSLNDSYTTKFIWGERLSNFSNQPPIKKFPKSSLKSASTAFLATSKKKILRLVTPKKDNKAPAVPFVARKTPLRSIGIQTSHEDLDQALQSPPGSYHSNAVNEGSVVCSTQPSTQPSTPTSTNNHSHSSSTAVGTQFDFNRTVHSPKKPNLHSQRKLNFPLNCAAGACLTPPDDSTVKSSLQQKSSTTNLTKSYRSFNTELEQDLSLSKMNYLLGNIRARLEASDDHAVRTFQETERRLERNGESFASVSSIPTRPARQRSMRLKNQQQYDIEPIYSEIEEDSIHISVSPQFDNKTGTDQFSTCDDPTALYAKVNKAVKQKNLQPAIITATTTVTTTKPAPLALGKFLHDSLKKPNIVALKTSKNRESMNNVAISDVTSSDTTYSTVQRQQHVTEAKSSTTPTVRSTTPGLSECQSMNNVRVMEHNSPPKKNRSLSKSDLSLHRSEIFLDNLCRSELNINMSNSGVNQTSLQKIENHQWTDSYASIQNPTIEATEHAASAIDAVSYELPPNDSAIDQIDGPDLRDVGNSAMAINTFARAHRNNQSTPKKNEIFTTKQLEMNSSLPLNLHISTNNFPEFLNESNSCPVTPSKENNKSQQTQKSQSCSLHENSNLNNESRIEQSQTSDLNQSTKAHYKRFKDALRKSFRKSKNFVKNETKRLSQSLSTPSSIEVTEEQSEKNKHTNDAISMYGAASSLYLEHLFAMDEMDVPVEKQLAQAVNICRQIPNLEISTEMVEAERLLLFSTLRDSKRKQQKQNLVTIARQENSRRYYIDAMRLPIKADSSQDMFFNNFYIVTFECGGIIKSTQSVECRNGVAKFEDCGIEFDCNCNLESNDADIRCEVFMLRLRKVSTLTLEPPKKIKLATPHSISSNGSSTDIVSRFRLHAKFTLKAVDFIPYEFVECESRNAETICLRSSSTFCIPITRCTKSTNLTNDIMITARAETRLPKMKFEGFLNVEDPQTQHNWNRRWCTLEGINMRIWQDRDTENELMVLDLRQSISKWPLSAAPRELCARPRAFCLQSSASYATMDKEVDVNVQNQAVFFAAETLPALNDWLQHLNMTLEFINKWMR